MTESFDTLYRAFEDKFRGTRDVIKERQRAYRPLLEQLPAEAGRMRRALDLGCGRGEWLEVAAEVGFHSAGVDLNAGMAQAALDRGFNVEIDDAVEYLRRQEAASASVITAFHIAEHLPVEKLLDLLYESYRVLEDGGLLIIETPNPENISVGTWTFHIDPTHQKPLPPVLLEFLTQQAGFERTAILRINGADVDSAAGSLEQAFQTIFGSARDYACLAHKQSARTDDDDILATFVAANTQPNPADTAPLIDAVRKIETSITSLHKTGIDQIATLTTELREAHRREISSRDEIELALRSATEREREIIALHASTSWKVTAPLRVVSHAARWLWRGPRWFASGVWAWTTFKPGSRPRRVLRVMLVWLAHFVLMRPRVASVGRRIARRLPLSMQSTLRRIAFRSSVPAAAISPAPPLPLFVPSRTIIPATCTPERDRANQFIASAIDEEAVQRVKIKLGAVP